MLMKLCIPGRSSSAILVAAVCVLCGFFSRGAVEIYAVFLPVLSAEFGWQKAEATSVYAFVHLGVGVMAIPIGRLYDRWGPYRIFTTGFLIVGLGMLLATQSTALWQFCLVVGFLGGIGMVILGPISSTLLMSRWYGANLPSSLGLVWTMSGIGVLVMAPTVQLLLDAYGWKQTYFLLAIVLLLVPLLLLAFPWSRLTRGVPLTAGGQARDAASENGKGDPFLVLIRGLATTETDI